MVSIVLPIYNEEKGLEDFIQILTSELNKIKDEEFEVILINDGSKDSSLSIIKTL